MGVPVGLLTGLTPSRLLDAGIRVGAVVLFALPPFFVGLMLLLVVSLEWGLAPAGGWASGWPDNLEYVWLPSLALAAYMTPIIVRTVRQSTRSIIDQPFVEAALLRGLPYRTVVLRHVLPNSLLPVVTLVGLNVATLVGGAVVIEALFTLPGIGTDLLVAVGSRDYPVIQGIALVTAVMVVIVNAGTDALYAIVDPRSRVSA
jgi:peptide/nickel transport system permease protein